MLLGIRPSGWEKNSKPSYGKRISTIGIEYSEHSSYKELERFVRFLVISTRRRRKARENLGLLQRQRKSR